MRSSASYTAEYVCWARAIEARNKPARRILFDPYAYDFLGILGRCFYWIFAATGPVGRWLMERIPNFNQYIVARHRVMDDWIHKVRPTQVVILGAGYDMRAMRLNVPSIKTFFEVDHPLTGARKRKLVTTLNHTPLPQSDPGFTRPDLHFISVDFQTEELTEKLLNSAFDPMIPTAWVWEGVSMYLNEDQVKATLAEIRRLSAPSSTLTLDLAFNPEHGAYSTLTMNVVRRVVSLLGEPWGMEIHPRDLQEWASQQGYEVTEIYTLSRLNTEVLGRRGGGIGALYVACLSVIDGQEEQV